MTKTKAVYKGLGNPKRARAVLDSLERNEWNSSYLKNLVANLTDNAEYADSLDYRGLRHQAHRIRGIAEKVLRIESERDESIGYIGKKARALNIKPEIEHKERFRQSALERQDGMTYFLLTSDLGLQAEDTELYERGQADYEFSKTLVKGD